MIFLAIFCSPLALLLSGKPISALFNLILYILSIVLWLTIIFHSVGFAFWAIAFIHALVGIDHARADRRARWIANASRR